MIGIRGEMVLVFVGSKITIWGFMPQMLMLRKKGLFGCVKKFKRGIIKNKTKEKKKDGRERVERVMLYLHSCHDAHPTKKLINFAHPK